MSTSDKAFFEERGYVPGEPLPLELQKFFADSYAFLKRQIGYHGTDRNILSAAVHLDETTPHLQLYYLPIVDEGRKKVYAKGTDGKVLRNEKGSPVQAKDKNGKSIYKRTQLKQPKICSSEFWEQRGAQTSFGNLQDEFYQQVACYYGLERGEVGSSKKHTTKYQWQKQQQEKELAERATALMQTNAQIEKAEASISAAEKRLAQNTIPRRPCRGKASPRGTRGAAARTRTRALDARSCPSLGRRGSVPAGERKKARQKADPRSPCGKCAARKRIGVQHQRPARALYGTARIGKGKSRSEKGRRYIAHDQSPRTRQTARGNGHCQAPARKQERALSRQFVVMDKVTFLQLNISKKTIAFIKEIW